MATKGTRADEHRDFWDIAEPLIASGRVVEGTLMGFQCLRARANDQFVATVERSTGHLVVKLPRARVDDLVASGDGLAFAPAGKVFKEWVAIPTFDERRWTELIREALEFVGG